MFLFYTCIICLQKKIQKYFFRSPSPKIICFSKSLFSYTYGKRIVLYTYTHSVDVLIRGKYQMTVPHVKKKHDPNMVIFSRNITLNTLNN